SCYIYCLHILISYVLVLSVIAPDPCSIFFPYTPLFRSKLRLYSVASPTEGEDGKQHLISTTVKRTIEEKEDNDLFLGVCSNYLANLQPGDKVKMTGPSGRRFLLPEEQKDFNYLFFATGTGIAPYRGMVMELLESGVTNDITLVFGCPYRTDLLYADYFEEMEEKYPNFHY